MKTIFAGIALAALVAAPALAADLPARPAPAPYKAPPPVYVGYSWTGCFLGGNGGGVWVKKDYSYTTGAIAAGTHDANSWLAGVQVGCDYQFAGGFVIGIQGDYDWANASGSHVDVFGVTHASNTKSLASVTGRLGYAWDRFLLYVRGGGAWERDNYTLTVPAIVGAAVIPGFAATASETRSGWTVGIGGEYAFTNWLSGFVEYDYYDFGTRTNNFVNPNTLATVGIDIRERKSVVKGGLNFRFGGGPVVARY
jgi:outer membrane immunogenic protein